MQLYRIGGAMSEVSEVVRRYCRSHLSEARYAHVVRVYETMQKLTRHYGLELEERKLALVGFGHDIARELPSEVLVLLLRLAGLELRPWETEYPVFCHTRAGVLLLKNSFGIDDAEVFEAVEHHTLGAPKMGVLARLLYLADFLEPKRPFLQDAERKAYMDMEFERCVYEVCRSSVEFLRRSQKSVFPPTLAMLKEFEGMLG